MNTNQENMSFKNYYSSLKTLHVELRDRICKALEFSEKTFYNKLNGDSFDYPEKLVISKITEKEIDELFPSTERREAV
jgi:hypothetical protein